MGQSTMDMKTETGLEMEKLNIYLTRVYIVYELYLLRPVELIFSIENTRETLSQTLSQEPWVPHILNSCFLFFTEDN